jgi:hypothetical protein
LSAFEREGKIFMLRRVLMVAVALSMPFCATAQVIETDSGLNLVTPFALLLESLKKANVSGSLEFSGKCPALVSWPHWRIPPAGNKPPLQVAQDTFADDPTIRVTQDADGTIRMIRDGVPTDLLNVKISHISRSYAHNPYDLADAVLWAREVEAFRRAHHIDIARLTFGVSGVGYPPPDPDAVDAMDDVTVSKAMDRVLKTFPGIWIYADCSEPNGKNRTVSFTFFSSSSKAFAVEINDSQ